jgi:hypothetical protein
MKAYALDEDEWSASRPGHFTPVERVFGTHWISCWPCYRNDLNDVEYRINLFHLPEIESYSCSPYPVTLSPHSHILFFSFHLLLGLPSGLFLLEGFPIKFLVIIFFSYC